MENKHNQFSNSGSNDNDVSWRMKCIKNNEHVPTLNEKYFNNQNECLEEWGENIYLLFSLKILGTYDDNTL